MAAFTKEAAQNAKAKNRGNEIAKILHNDLKARLKEKRAMKAGKHANKKPKPFLACAPNLNFCPWPGAAT